MRAGDEHVAEVDVDRVGLDAERVHAVDDEQRPVVPERGRAA